MEQLLGSWITYHIASGPQQGRKVFTLQTLLACEEPFDGGVARSLDSRGVGLRSRLIPQLHRILTSR